jgi:hypothetical protein
MYGLACERCRVGALCGRHRHGLDRDVRKRRHPKVRHVAIFVLARLRGRDARVRAVLDGIAERDDDALVRKVARAAVEGRRHPE